MFREHNGLIRDMRQRWINAFIARWRWVDETIHYRQHILAMRLEQKAAELAIGGSTVCTGTATCRHCSSRRKVEQRTYSLYWLLGLNLWEPTRLQMIICSSLCVCDFGSALPTPGGNEPRMMPDDSVSTSLSCRTVTWKTVARWRFYMRVMSTRCHLAASYKLHGPHNYYVVCHYYVEHR